AVAVDRDFDGHVLPPKTSHQDTKARRKPFLVSWCLGDSNDFFDCRDDVFDGKTKMLEQHARWRGFAVSIDADHGTARIVCGADILAPEGSHTGLDRDARHASRKNAFPISDLLPLEEARARHRNNANRDALLRQRLLRSDSERDLGPGGDDDRARRSNVT